MERLAGKKWSVSDIKKCELRILNVLSFALKSMTAYDFAGTFLYHFQCENEVCYDYAKFEEEIYSLEQILDAIYTSIFCYFSQNVKKIIQYIILQKSQ